MNRIMKATSAVMVLAAILLLSTGCTRIDLREEGGRLFETVRLGTADEVEVDLRMGPGDLTIDSGARALMEGEFYYSDGRTEPRIDYDVRSGVGELTIDQSNERGWFGFVFIGGGHYNNEWDLSFDDDVPMTMDLELGAGDADIDMGSAMVTDFELETGAGEITVSLRGSETLEDMRLDAGAGDINIDLSNGAVLQNLDVAAGAGSITIDLSGDHWLEDLDAQIIAGAGDITLIVPEGVGVIVNVTTGIGDLDADDFRRKGGSWVNDSYGDSAVLLGIDIEQGVGSVRLEIE